MWIEYRKNREKNPEENETSCQKIILHSSAKVKLREKKKKERKFSKHTVHDIFSSFYIAGRVAILRNSEKNPRIQLLWRTILVKLQAFNLLFY